MTTPVRVAVTGAAGAICYSMLFRIAAGEMLGKDTPVILQLIEIPPGMKALEGVVMELDDCAFPLLHGIEISDDPNKGTERNVDILDDSAMENALNICHNVQVWLLLNWRTT